MTTRLVRGRWRFVYLCCGVLLLAAMISGSASAWQHSHGHFGHRHGSYGHYGHRHYGHQHYGHRHYGHYGHSGFHLGFGYQRSYGHYHSHLNYYPRYSLSFRYSPRYDSYSRLYSYPYGYHYSRPSYGLYSYSAPRIYTYRLPSTASDPYAGATDHLLSGLGWDYLAADRPTEAWSEFAVQATNNLTKGGPKIGYALAAATAGDLSKGVWAMRRACSIDPTALHYVKLNEALSRCVDQLVERYDSVIARDGANRDAFFMLAALHYLAGETAAAQTAIDQAVRNGDQTESAQQLRRLIDQKRAEQESLELPPPQVTDDEAPAELPEN